jgi:alpha-glucosidase
MGESKLEFVGNIKSHKISGDTISFVLNNALLNVYVVENNIIRFRYTEDKEFSKAPSYAVINSALKKENFTFTDKGEYFLLTTKELNVEISKNPCRISIYDSKMNLINEDEKSFGVSFDEDKVKCYKKLFNDESFFGLGEKTGGLNKKGNQYTMWNTDHPAYDNTWDPLYVSIPFFIGVRNTKAYGIFFDNTYKSYFNMGASNNRFYWFGADNGEMNYYFIYGPEIKKVITSYTELTGRMQLPPMWALGYQQSKWSYCPESTVKRTAKTFREEKIPCDVIYLDIDYMNGYRVFTWNKNRFPNPVKMLNDLKNEGFKIIPIIDPGVKADTGYFAAKEGLSKNLFAKYPDGDVYQGEVWPSWAYFPDFTKKEARDWWGEKLSTLLKDGVSGFWNDMNEPSVWGQAFPDLVQFNDNGYGASHKKIHNVYALEEAKATFDAFQKYSPNERRFLLTRAGFSGIQRYSAVWTGDNVASEEHLKLACLMPLGMGISGISFVGSDVGGFIGLPSHRLYTRWMELGAFTPFFRGHSVINQNDKEPWAFGVEVENWVRDIISLRYRLLPFFYNEFYNSSISGLPIMRPMFLDFQNDNECYSVESQYQFMIGDNLLVAPVVSETDNFKKLYLPKGKWIDWWNNKVYNGNQWIIVDAPIYQIPLFIKKGGFIPMQDVEQFTGQKKMEELEVDIFPATSSNYSLYEDDGISYDYKNGKYSITSFESNLSDTSGVISIKHDYNKFNSGRKDYLLKILNTGNVSNVFDNKTKIQKYSSQAELRNSIAGFYFDERAKILFVKVANEKNIKVQYDF